MKTYSKLLVLSMLVSTTCGFTWGKSSEEKCTEAKKLVQKLAVSSSAERGALEARIIELCTDGAAGQHVRAMRLEREGKTDAAIKTYKDALREDPEFYQANGNLGLIYLQKGMRDDAAVELTRGLAGGADPRYHKALARIFNERQLYPLAIYHYNEALKGSPADAALHSEFAEVYSKLEKKSNAEDQYRKAITLDSRNDKARLGLINLYLGNEQYDKAIAELKKAQLANPQDKELHRMLAEAYEKTGDLKSADYEFLLAGKTRVVLTSELILKGDGFMAKGEYDKAIDEYRAALREKPELSDAQKKLAAAYLAAKRDDEALAAYKELARIKGADGGDLFVLASLYERKGLFDEAVVAYKQSLNMNGDNLEARRRLADLYSQHGNYPQAVEQYKTLIARNAGDAQVRFKLARVYVSVKNFKDALTEYKETVRLDPDNLDAHRELAALYKKNNQSEESEREFKEVLRLKKDDADARNALTAIYVKDKKYDELITLLKEGVEQNPKDAANRYKLGLIYEFKKDYESAIGQYKESVELKSDHAKALNALGRVYMRTGRFNEAKETLEAAKKADPGLEETAVLLSNIKEEMSPDSRKYKKKSKKGKKGKKGTPKKKGGKTSGKSAKSGKAAKKKAE